MKFEKLKNGNWIINGVEFTPKKETPSERLLQRLQAECADEWEVFFGEGQEPEEEYEYQVWSQSLSRWAKRQTVETLRDSTFTTIYRRRLKTPKELPTQSINPDQLPLRLTMRDGTHWTAVELTSSAKNVHCVRKGWIGCSIVVSLDGYHKIEKNLNDYDVIYVGDWLSSEELDEMRNE